MEGAAQKMPFADQSADTILFQASFHHVPAAAMAAAAGECRRVLKNGGRAVFVEPVYRAGAYTEITRLVEDEERMQKKAYAAIVVADRVRLGHGKRRVFFYVERSFADYIHLIEFFVDDDGAARLFWPRRGKSPKSSAPQPAWPSPISATIPSAA